MNKENTEKLFNDFPELYVGKDKSIQESLMVFGFECMDGWFNLIYNLSKQITDYCKEKNIPVPEAIQVKEKYGGLRFYLVSYPEIKEHMEAISEMIDKAENLSEKICQKCGSEENVTSTSGWITFLCDRCK